MKIDRMVSIIMLLLNPWLNVLKMLPTNCCIWKIWKKKKTLKRSATFAEKLTAFPKRRSEG